MVTQIKCSVCGHAGGTLVKDPINKDQYKHHAPEICVFYKQNMNAERIDSQDAVSSNEPPVTL
jgi:hypothetical protein